MATKSPGIYFHEIDNTQFMNPKAYYSGTILAIVGYARKGPIGVPVFLESWSDFKNVFGKPVDGFYSGLAVHTFISAGGAVLFTRVADESIAKPSVFVMKNGTPAVDGYVKFSHDGRVIKQSESYDLASHYCFKLSKDSESKYIFIDTPNTTLEKKDLIAAITNQLPATPARWEAKLKEVPGLYGFNVEVNGVKNSDEDYYINVSSTEKKSSIAEQIRKRLEDGSNPMFVINFANTGTYDETPSAKAPAATYDSIKGKKKFILKKVNGSKTEETVYEVDMASNSLTIEEIARILNEKLNASAGINVYSVQGDNGNSYSKLVFVGKKVEDNFSITSFTKDGKPTKDDLFASQTGTPETIDGFVVNTDGTEGSWLNVSGVTKVKGKKGISLPYEVSNYDSKMDTFTIETIAKGDENSIKLIDIGRTELKNTAISPFTKLKDDESGKIEHEGIFGNIYNYEGQKELKNILVKREYESDGGDTIKFVALGSIKPPMLEKGSTDEFVGGKNSLFKDFLPVMRKESDASGTGTGVELPVEGKEEKKDESRDMVVFTSKELGSGTNNVDIDVWSKKDFNGNIVSYGIDVYVDGIRKESYEDISLKYAIEDTDPVKRFDLVINESPENGGSAYFKINILKNDHEDPNVQIKQGRFHIGKQNKESDIIKNSSMPDDGYRSFDYSIGNDGVPEGSGSYLFEDAMRPGTSALANKELYDFHILICPDNISQEVQTAQIKLCEDREDAITIIDPPVGLSKKEVIDWHNGRGSGRNVVIESNYAATYWPWCKVVDTVSSGDGKERYTWVMPSIVMAAQYVIVDIRPDAGPHMAPAGEVNGKLGVIDIEQYPNQLDRDELYVDYNRVNPITKFKNGDIVAYGEKTTQRTNSVLTKIHTRRMLVKIKKECREALRGYIFMPNTTSYLGKIKNNITSILDYYKKRGGINFFKVICDESNNPVELRQQDIINVDAVIVPEGTIEQINISLTLNKSAETVTD